MSIHNGVNGTLEVYVGKVKDLSNLRKIEKHNPIVKLRIAHMTQISEKLQFFGQTSVFGFHSVFHLTPDMNCVLHVELYGDERSGVKIISKCEVDLRPALYSDPEDGYHGWHELWLGSLKVGKIYLELTFTQQRLGVQKIQSAVAGVMKGKEKEDKIVGVGDTPRFSSEIADSSQLSSAGSYSREKAEFSANALTYKHGGDQFEFISKSLRTDSQSQDEHNSSHLGFTHAPRKHLNSTPDFASSANSYTNEDLYESQNSKSTGITAKLKQLKEKWYNFKQGASEQDESARADVDLEALQKIVGVPPESSESPTSSDGKISLEFPDRRPSLPALPTHIKTDKLTISEYGFVSHQDSRLFSYGS